MQLGGRIRPTWLALAATLLVLAAAAPPLAAQPLTLTRPPRVKTFVEADYPPAAKAAGITADVVLSVEINADGTVGNVGVVTSGGPEFDAAAVAAMKRFLFHPAHIDGQPAPVKITYRYRFKVETQVVKLGPQVNFAGVVLERFTKKPLAGVQVTLKNSKASRTTNALGAFEFIDVPLGKELVELSGPNLITVTTEEEIQAGQKKLVRYFVEAKSDTVDEEQVVRAPRVKKESVQVVIRTEEARRVPGTQGDSLKVVQNLPGVARSGVGSGALIVWGSSPRDTRVNVDGVEIPQLYHVGGLRSTLSSGLVRSIDLAPGGYGADYGRGLGGLVRVETRTLPKEGVHGYVAADLLDAQALITAAPTPDLRIGVAGRFSYLDRILSGVIDPRIGDFFPIPRYDDYQAMAQLTLRKDEELTLLFLASDDHLRRTVPSQDPAQVRSENTDQSFYRLILRYTRVLPDGSSVVVTPFWGYDTELSTTKFGLTPTSAQVEAMRYGLRASYRAKVSPKATLTTGLDVQGSWAHPRRSGSLTLPPREGDVVVFGQPPGDDINADDWTVHLVDAAPFVSTELRLGDRLTVVPGFRLETMFVSGSPLLPRVVGYPPVGYARAQFGADPRLQASYTVNPRVTINAGGGLYHQPPAAEDLSPVFGNPKLGLQSAVHGTLGVKVGLTGTLSAEVVGFYKHLFDLISRNEAPTPPLGQALVQEGEGRSYGGQILLRQELSKGFFGWITYALSRSERRDHPGSDWRLFDYDQTHVLGVVASYEYRGWILGTRFRYGTGFPRTAVTGAFYDARGDQYQPLFGQHNAIRIPDFVQWDLRLEKTFTWQRLSLSAYADVQNVTNRKNAEEIVYNYNFTRRDYISGLPTLAIVGAKLQW
jgi:TonB family protein